MFEGQEKIQMIICIFLDLHIFDHLILVRLKQEIVLNDCLGDKDQIRELRSHISQAIPCRFAYKTFRLLLFCLRRFAYYDVSPTMTFCLRRQ